MLVTTDSFDRDDPEKSDMEEGEEREEDVTVPHQLCHGHALESCQDSRR
jgi:hypothetical protein